ncbi:5-(carboxyamino)imidazole ribonucleotide synthase [Marinomonas mediterranea]|uniref:5-(carboxyamino)imidazole ribonucleotide synthase n=1 Tax=Marinomonas mediterranea TaxID=119864 RepID=UPI00234B24F1|nr:5-(carboxyamino)imidazole ribonucleotide synthase [Marinomonas mediterranea]WCN08139.1 5-(carboxyamino)imidazole ribonucleotide synthase [Marinomonas mediterranea]WCN12208.1 5-(carboxyamino)imidazole ribonucleotide synthase [Marinomonas mediterranea]
MSRIWVLGAGQLGAMLKQAATPLGLDVRPVDIETKEVLPLHEDDIVTAEREDWPETEATKQLASHKNFVNLSTFPQLADRLTQKQWIDKLDLATAPWFAVEDDSTAQKAYDQLGERVLMKRRRGGYDGKGQYWLKQAEGTEIPEDWKGLAIAEQAINFDEEVSVVGVRGKNGEKYFYPLTLNLHINGILYASVSPLDRLKPLQAKAEAMLGKLMDALDYVGVMAMECFRIGDDLLINELAPRVHNSGHWTQAGASVNQFENHIRAVAGLPLAPAEIKNQSMMVNLIGVDVDYNWLASKGLELYWYKKEVRPGRKVGHLNACSGDIGQLKAILNDLSNMPAPYDEALSWLESNLPN